MHAPPLLVPPTLAPGNGGTGIGVILRNLAALIARRFLRDPFHAALIIPLWQHLTRAARRLDSLLVRLAAGPLPPPRPRTGPHSSGPRRKSPFPATRAWLIQALGFEAAAYASQLEALLADPAAADLLGNTAARRTLAPIRRMLGLPPAPRPVTPAAASAAPLPSAPPRKTPPRSEPIPHLPTLDLPPKRKRRPWWLPPPRKRSG